MHLFRAKLIARFDHRYPKQNFLSPEFGTKFHREVHIFEIPEFPFNAVYRMGGRELPCQKPARFVHPFR